jgi:hypothetical protein
VKTPLAAVVVLLVAAPGYAQTAAKTAVNPRAPQVELEFGVGLFSGAGLGSGDAELRANAQARQPYRLFSADSRFARAPAVHLRVAVPLGPRLGLEGGVTWSRPDIRTSLTADADGAAPLTAVEQVHQYVFDASVVWMLQGLRLGERVIPFVSGGGGYLRQLHEGRTLVEHGQAYHAGGGIKYSLFTRSRQVVRSAGFKAEARLELLRGGIAFEDHPRRHAAISGSVFVGF